MGQSAVSFRSNWQNNKPVLWVLVSKAKHPILWAADLLVCQMLSPCWTGRVHFDPELERNSFGFGFQLTLNFLYFQRPQYSIRKLGNLWIMEKTCRDEMISHDYLTARESKPAVIGEESGWCNELPWELSLRHELAVMAEPFAAESCWCVAKQARWNQHLLGELHGKWLFWQNYLVVHLCCVLSSKLTSKIPNYASWGCWNTTRWAWGIFSAMAFHCLHCYFREFLCERVHFANKKYFLQNWVSRIEA